MSAQLGIAFDTETTGLVLHPSAKLSLQPRIIELGAVLFSLETGETDEEISILINPEIEITDEITGITGISNDDVRDAPTLRSVMPSIVRAFGSAAAVVAHNLPFDRAMIRNELARLGMTEFPWPGREFCTIELYRPEWGREMKLVELYAAALGCELAQTHRALDDVRALMEVIRKDALWQLMK